MGVPGECAMQADMRHMFFESVVSSVFSNMTMAKSMTGSLVSHLHLLECTSTPRSANGVAATDVLP